MIQGGHSGPGLISVTGGIVLFFLFSAEVLPAQEVNFGSYFNYSLSLGELTAEDLNFGTIASSGGFYEIGLNEAKIITLTGIKYLDVIVDISSTPDFYLDGNPSHDGDAARSVPFTLQAGYANNGSNNLADLRAINLVANSATVRFPILRRQSLPPGPPPAPPTEGFNPALFEETAYIYLYGSLNVGNVIIGTYSTDITITVFYD